MYKQIYKDITAFIISRDGGILWTADSHKGDIWGLLFTLTQIKPILQCWTVHYIYIILTYFVIYFFQCHAHLCRASLVINNIVKYPNIARTVTQEKQERWGVGDFEYRSRMNDLKPRLARTPRSNSSEMWNIRRTPCRKRTKKGGINRCTQVTRERESLWDYKKQR